MTIKVDVKGENSHEIYSWAKKNFGRSTIPKWNFHKILINREGKIQNTYNSFVDPLSSKIIKEIERFYEYELPKNLVGIIWKGKFRGQKQKWFITKFTDNEDKINLKTKHPEFIEWKWINVEMLPEVIVEFKKDLYTKLLKEIKLVIS